MLRLLHLHLGVTGTEKRIVGTDAQEAKQDLYYRKGMLE